MNLHNVKWLSKDRNNRLSFLLDEVHQNVLAYREVLIEAEKATRSTQLKALAAIYALHSWFEEFPTAREAFYSENNIEPNSRSKYVAQPLVRYFISHGEPCAELQTKASYWAGAIEAGILKNVDSEIFEDFIRETKGGVHGAYLLASKWYASRNERYDRSVNLANIEESYKEEHQQIKLPQSVHTDGIKSGRYVCVVEIDANGDAYLSARISNEPKDGEAVFQKHIADWSRNNNQRVQEKKPVSNRRYKTAKKRQHSIVLNSDEPVAIQGKTKHPHLVRIPNQEEWVLKSGQHSRKLGSIITKGKWKGFPVYGLTLEERATCPRSCKQWLNCYGNGMSQNRAYRYQHGTELIEALERELTILSLEAKTRNGYAIRLHTLGDFYDVDYVEFWKDKLLQHPALRVFGFTAWHPKETEIGKAIKLVTDNHWERFAIRFSNQPESQRGSSVVSSEEHAPNKGNGIVCPAELGYTQSCSTCGYCWQSEKPVVFIEH